MRLMSFPAIEFKTEANSNDNGITSLATEDGVSISMYQHRKYVLVSMSTPFGPQPIQVQARLRRHADCVI